MRLQGKVAVILGASGQDNIGQAIARRFQIEGAKIIVAARRLEALSTFGAATGATPISCDIEKDGAADELMQAVKNRFGHIDLCVNAVGGGTVGSFTEVTRAELEHMTSLQFIAPFQLLQAFLKTCEDGASFVNISSIGAVRVIEDQAAYTATKAGFDHVVRVVANEAGARGIRINSLSPGLTDTPMSRDLLTNDAFVKAFSENYPLGRIGTRDEVAAAAVYLASDECFMTGENLQVNGGVGLRRLPNRAEMAAAFAARSS